MKKCSAIYDYWHDIVSGKIASSKRLKKAMRLIEKALDDEDVYIDVEKTDKSIELIEKYFDMTLLAWERFIIGLVHCFYKSNDTVVFREFLIVMGRGNGKNGFISGLVWYLTTHYHGINGYNVDIIANSEDQAKTSFEDVYNVLENFKTVMRKFFTWTLMLIKNNQTKSYIKYNTSNSRTKDGKRSACLVFDELHEYENDANIKVFSSGFGKRKHSRKFKITTKGYVIDGVLDDDLALADKVLSGEVEGIGLCPLIYEIDAEHEALDPDMWEKANPSIRYFPELKKEIDVNLIEMAVKSSVEADFYTKRMNWPRLDAEIKVASIDQLKATNQELPNFNGMTCVAGIDYALLNDMASVGLLFRIGDKRYWLQHSWICKQSADYKRIKPPLEEWQDRGDLTIVDDVQIHPRLIVDWLFLASKQYNITKLAIDLARFALLREHLSEIGFDSKVNKNIYFVRPLGIASASPVIESLFATGNIAWGDVPLMRWAANNTKRVRMKTEGASGNFKYDKIEPKSRKTDPFMAFVHAMVIDDELSEANNGAYVWDLPDNFI